MSCRFGLCYGGVEKECLFEIPIRLLPNIDIIISFVLSSAATVCSSVGCYEATARRTSNSVHILTRSADAYVAPSPARRLSGQQLGAGGY